MRRDPCEGLMLGQVVVDKDYLLLLSFVSSKYKPYNDSAPHCLKSAPSITICINAFFLFEMTTADIILQNQH